MKRDVSEFVDDFDLVTSINASDNFKRIGLNDLLAEFSARARYVPGLFVFI